ncbi:MAG: 2-polyprenyl-3-methyl-6-methoxy-1,4-benzoquinone monooxygenase, partial [Betaproteobacteria bacterium]
TGHLDRLPSAVVRTRASVAVMRAYLARHRATALELGAAELPALVKGAMRLASRVMTTVAYRL